MLKEDVKRTKWFHLVWLWFKLLQSVSAGARHATHQLMEAPFYWCVCLTAGFCSCVGVKGKRDDMLIKKKTSSCLFILLEWISAREAARSQPAWVRRNWLEKKIKTISDTQRKGWEKCDSNGVDEPPIQTQSYLRSAGRPLQNKTEKAVNKTCRVMVASQRNSPHCPLAERPITAENYPHSGGVVKAALFRVVFYLEIIFLKSF